MVLLTPRSIWHQHHDEADDHRIVLHDDHDSKDSHSGDLDEDCFQCDYDLDIAPQALSFEYRFAPKNTYKHSEITNYFVTQQKFDFDNLRGPPNA